MSDMTVPAKRNGNPLLNSEVIFNLTSSALGSDSRVPANVNLKIYSQIQN